VQGFQLRMVSATCECRSYSGKEEIHPGICSRVGFCIVPIDLTLRDARAVARSCQVFLSLS
jgi:hypothetical protein